MDIETVLFVVSLVIAAALLFIGTLVALGKKPVPALCAYSTACSGLAAAFTHRPVYHPALAIVLVSLAGAGLLSALAVVLRRRAAVTAR